MKRDNKGYWVGRGGLYNVRILENGKRRFIGVYNTEDEAIEAYTKACETKLSRSVEKYGHSLSDGVIYKKY